MVAQRIISLQNPLVKQILAVKEKSRERKKTGLFVIEGRQELELAVRGGYCLQKLLFCPEIAMDGMLETLQKETIVEVSKAVYEKLAHRGSTEGILALAKAKSHDVKDLCLSQNPLVLVAESVEKPGNVGALLRTADAAKLDAVFIADPKADLYNPNTIRASLGCVFTQQIGVGSSEEILAFLKNKGICVLGAALSASKPYMACDFTAPTAVVVGTEATGLSDTWLAGADQHMVIPMQGAIDSLNVSVSAAILIFEAKRQRGI